VAAIMAAVGTQGCYAADDELSLSTNASPGTFAGGGDGLKSLAQQHHAAPTAARGGGGTGRRRQ